MGSSTSKDIPLGTVIRETYEIAGVLGRGGMGTVFLANHLRLPGRQVAIKVLRNDGGLGAEVYVRFRREAEIASRLGHPNIIEVLDFDTLADGSPFLVMECLRGQPLSRRLRRGGALTLEEVFNVSRQMGSALQAAHRAGIVHRDLKPGNVFLVPTEVGGVVMEHVKLLDFGISKIIDSTSVHTQGGILLGTPQYMAPEQAQGKNQEVDPRTDIFSFGCMVYEMLARRLPFKDGPLPELIYRIVYDPPDPLRTLVPGVPEQVVEAIERALEKRPEDRYPDVGSFIEALTGSPLQTLSPQQVPVPALAVRPSQMETVGMKRSPPVEVPASQRPTVDGRRPASEASAQSAGSSKRPVVNVPLHEVSTMTVGAPAAPVPPDAPAAGPSTQMVRPDVGVAQGSAPFLETGGSRARWWWTAAVLVLVGAVALAVGLRLMGSRPPPVVPHQGVGLQQGAVSPGAAPAQQGTASSGQAGTSPAQPPANALPGQVGAPPSQPVDNGATEPPPAQNGAALAQPGSVPGAVAAPPSGTDARPVATSTRKGSSTPIPKAVLEDLAAGEKALARGDAEEALHLARRSQRVQVTSSSFSLLVRAHCRQRDLSNARTVWESVPAWERTKVRRYCKQYEIAL
ncbi:serine/threonine-protein kinase [Myxococcus sp. RHSTA-1-4]|uniref:serine/threonine-protein kinase n=1 Tax=Myxococcus sp. RHSTA-1-4 TaxID=2874601 RepID=UPI001CC0048B|nr:serine/threonine-protein kinase [Myxococcus sp. RHSTA-1-4]MBZ4415493.1 protein kinase [Myxococcus sp. RHSTA-1-4]